MIITLPYPPLINATYKMGNGRFKVGRTRFYKSQEAKDWQEIAGWAVRRQWKQPMITDYVRVCLVLFYAGKEPDVDAGAKIVLDLLERQRVVENDRLVKPLILDKKKDIDRPRVEVQI